MASALIFTAMHSAFVQWPNILATAQMYHFVNYATELTYLGFWIGIILTGGLISFIGCLYTNAFGVLVGLTCGCSLTLSLLMGQLPVLLSITDSFINGLTVGSLIVIVGSIIVEDYKLFGAPFGTALTVMSLLSLTGGYIFKAFEKQYCYRVSCFTGPIIVLAVLCVLGTLLFLFGYLVEKRSLRIQEQRDNQG